MDEGRVIVVDDWLVGLRESSKYRNKGREGDKSNNNLRRGEKLLSEMSSWTEEDVEVESERSSSPLD